MAENLRVGFRFHPTDEELVSYYLKHKLKADDPSIHDTIREIDVCKYDPWDLPAFSAIKSDDPEWFFFSPLDYKYSNSTRSNRATPRGFWKPTGKNRKIMVRGTNRAIGTKKTLVFYERGAPRGVKTNWVIHEYHDDLTFPADQKTFVLCKLIEKPKKKTDGNNYEFLYEKRMPTAYEDENPEEQCFSNPDSIDQTPLDLDEFVNSLIQTPLNLDDQTSLKSDDQIPLKVDDLDDQTTLKSPQSHMNLLMIQTPLK